MLLLEIHKSLPSFIFCFWIITVKIQIIIIFSPQPPAARPSPVLGKVELHFKAWKSITYQPNPNCMDNLLSQLEIQIYQISQIQGWPFVHEAQQHAGSHPPEESPALSYQGGAAQGGPLQVRQSQQTDVFLRLKLFWSNCFPSSWKPVQLEQGVGNKESWCDIWDDRSQTSQPRFFSTVVSWQQADNNRQHALFWFLARGRDQDQDSSWFLRSAVLTLDVIPCFETVNCLAVIIPGEKKIFTLNSNLSDRKTQTC